jgi:hypothetical protein
LSMATSPFYSRKIPLALLLPFWVETTQKGNLPGWRQPRKVPSSGLGLQTKYEILWRPLWLNSCCSTVFCLWSTRRIKITRTLLNNSDILIHEKITRFFNTLSARLARAHVYSQAVVRPSHSRYPEL